jgi:hypothetical protein
MGGGFGLAAAASSARSSSLDMYEMKPPERMGAADDVWGASVPWRRAVSFFLMFCSLLGVCGGGAARRLRGEVEGGEGGEVARSAQM